MKKYTGDLQLQIYDQKKNTYEPYEWVTLARSEKPIASATAADVAVAREIAAGRPWRIARCDRPLEGEKLKNHGLCRMTWRGFYP